MKLVIADDHHIVRKGLVYFLESHPDIQILAEADNGEDAIQAYKKHKPDLLLMDIEMPKMNGIEATKKILVSYPNAKVFILTSYSEKDVVIPALVAGACGYQLKDADPSLLVHTLKAALSGETPLDQRIMKHVLSHMANPSNEQEKRLARITERELDVLKEISTGKSNKEIASALFITEKTVKTHVSNLLNKLELNDRTQAALFAIQTGIAKPAIF
ncbi:response regulator [Shouchella patagoniensis]|uniref:response regulator n=1 Tax=Shouchella patagoniensis TaxID=228576 RepID=UPI000994E88C|nr:response regulator transcription factor [Shouchella patagoniensis]